MNTSEKQSRNGVGRCFTNTSVPPRTRGAFHRRKHCSVLDCLRYERNNNAPRRIPDKRGVFRKPWYRETALDSNTNETHGSGTRCLYCDGRFYLGTDRTDSTRDTLYRCATVDLVFAEEKSKFAIFPEHPVRRAVIAIHEPPVCTIIVKQRSRHINTSVGCENSGQSAWRPTIFGFSAGSFCSRAFSSVAFQPRENTAALGCRLNASLYVEECIDPLFADSMAFRAAVSTPPTSLSRIERRHYPPIDRDIEWLTGFHRKRGDTNDFSLEWIRSATLTGDN